MVFAMVKDIKLFGALKKFGHNGLLQLEAPEGTTVMSFRQILKAKIYSVHGEEFKSEILDKSAIACGSKLLGDKDIIPKSESIVVLPPVCGG